MPKHRGKSSKITSTKDLPAQALNHREVAPIAALHRIDLRT
ncbi:MAG: hypothetical protein ACI8Z5_000686, partial [Lentimonas sp.]